MLTALLLLLQTPTTPHADLWIPECKSALSSEGPQGYRICARAANEERDYQLGLKVTEYRALLSSGGREEGLAAFDADTQSFIAYRDQHCDYFAKAIGRIPVLEDNRRLSCRYRLTDRRLAEVNSMIVLYKPVIDQS